MSKRPLAIGAAVITALGVVVLLVTSMQMLVSRSVAGVAIGCALATFAVVCGLLVVNNVRFAVRADGLMKAMLDEGGDCGLSRLPTRPSGRVKPESALQNLLECESNVQQVPDDWKAWFLLAHAYEISRDHHASVAALHKASALRERSVGVNRR